MKKLQNETREESYLLIIFGLLMSSGVEVIKASLQVKELASDKFRVAFQKIHDEVFASESVSEAMRRCDSFYSFAVDFIASGEECAETSKTLRRVGELLAKTSFLPVWESDDVEALAAHIRKLCFLLDLEALRMWLGLGMRLRLSSFTEMNRAIWGGIMQDMTRGDTLSEAIAPFCLFRPEWVKAIAAAEQDGSLDFALEKIISSYEQEIFGS